MRFNRLSVREIELFHRDGFIGPYTLCSEDEMTPVRRRIEKETLASVGPAKTSNQGRHQDCRVIYDLVANSSILERATGILGPDLLLWATFLWNKGPGAKEIPWHQDLNFWPIDPPVNLTAWLAIDPATAKNACLRFLPGSHRRILKHIPATADGLLAEMADPDTFDPEKAINMELRPGQFVLFGERILHKSDRNNSQDRRLGLAARFTVPFVKIHHNQPPLYPGHRAILVAGQDYAKKNQLMQPPAGERCLP